MKIRVFNQKKFQRQIAVNPLGDDPSFLQAYEFFLDQCFLYLQSFCHWFFDNAIYVESIFSRKALKTSFIILLVAIIVHWVFQTKCFKTLNRSCRKYIFMIGMIANLYCG